MLKSHRAALHAIAVVALAFGVPSRAYAAGAQEIPPPKLAAGGLDWKPLASLPPGAQIAVLHGAPAKTGPYVIRVRFPPNYRVPPHSHSDNRTYTVISGTLYEANGDSFEDARLEPKPAGSFEAYVAGTTHFDATRAGEVIFQVQGNGPSLLTYVDRAADPRGPAAPMAAPEHHAFVPDEIRWGEPPPTTPCGAKMAILDGDPKVEGSLFTLRLRFPAGCKIMPHFHPSDEHVTVISGDFAMGMGNLHDDRALEALPAGGFAVMPAGMHHFALARSECVIQLHALGPFKTTYVNPADDPRNQRAAR